MVSYRNRGIEPMGVVGSAESGVSPVIAEVRSQTGLLIVKSDTETNGRKRGE